MKKAVIFDLDGTLLDTLDDLTDGVNHALEEFGRPLQTREEVRLHIGNGIGNLIARSLEKHFDDPCYDAILNCFRTFYTENCMVRTDLYPGIADMMRKLSEMGTGTAIVSNKNDAAVRELSEHYFHGLVKSAVGEKKGVKRKPAPDTILKALENIGAAPEDAVYVGDSEPDLEAADNAGMDLILVSWGFRGRERLEEITASDERGEGLSRMIVDDPAEIIELIK